MPAWLTGLLPTEGLKIVLVLCLSFLVGLEREEHRAEFKVPEPYAFGGVRTFPLIALIGYASNLISGGSWSFRPWVSRSSARSYGSPTSISLRLPNTAAPQLKYPVWLPTSWASGFARRILDCHDPRDHQCAVAGAKERPGESFPPLTWRRNSCIYKFLLLTAVILPVMPNRTFGTFGFNPFKAWLIVVAASGISYGSYLVEKASGGRGGVYLSALLGGAYSSTVTTVILAKRACEAHAPRVFAGGILMSSGMMYLRLLILLAIFDRRLAAMLLLPFIAAALGAIIFGWFWARGADSSGQSDRRSLDVKNPLELSAAFLFALLFAVLLAASHYALERFGRGGIYGLAAITGLTDIDPFVLGMTQSEARA